MHLALCSFNSSILPALPSVQTHSSMELACFLCRKHLLLAAQARYKLSERNTHVKDIMAARTYSHIMLPAIAQAGHQHRSPPVPVPRPAARAPPLLLAPAAPPLLAALAALPLPRRRAAAPAALPRPVSAAGPPPPLPAALPPPLPAALPPLAPLLGATSPPLPAATPVAPLGWLLPRRPRPACRLAPRPACRLAPPSAGLWLQQAQGQAAVQGSALLLMNGIPARPSQGHSTNSASATMPSKSAAAKGRATVDRTYTTHLQNT